MPLAGPGSLQPTRSRLTYALSTVLPRTATSESRVLPAQLVVPQNVAQQPLSRRFSDFPALGSLALGPVWSRWAAASHPPWPYWLEQPMCTAEMPHAPCGPLAVAHPCVCVCDRCAHTWCALPQGGHTLPRVLPAQRQRAVTYGEDEPHGPVLEPAKHVHLGTASISCQSVSLLGRPGATDTSPAGACPLLPLGLLFGDFSAICSDASSQGFLDSPRRAGHCLRLQTCTLDPGSRQRHWQPPGSYAVSCDRARYRMGVQLEKVGRCPGIRAQPHPASTPSALPPPPVPPSWVPVWAPTSPPAPRFSHCFAGLFSPTLPGFFG